MKKTLAGDGTSFGASGSNRVRFHFAEENMKVRSDERRRGKPSSDRPQEESPQARGSRCSQGRTSRKGGLGMIALLSGESSAG